MCVWWGGGGGMWGYVGECLDIYEDFFIATILQINSNDYSSGCRSVAFLIKVRSKSNWSIADAICPNAT
jgi:hypothetical protein